MLAVSVLTAAAQPEVTWLERSHDFGVILEQDGKATCQLRFTNTGNDPLMIVRAQAGCGCTGINYPESPILPGDTAAVSITYNPAGRPGQFSKQVIIFTNTSIKRTILEITGNVIPTDKTLDKQYPLRAGSLRISQTSIPMGELVRGKSSTQYLSAYNSATDTILVSVSGDKPHLKPAVVPDTVPPARVTALTVHYLSRQAPQWGLNTDTLTLYCEPLRQPSTAIAGKADVHVMAQVIESFDGLTDQQRSDAPVVGTDCGDRLDFGTIAAGEVATRSFNISNKGRERLNIRRIWVPDGEGISVKVDRDQVKRGKAATVTVTVDTSFQHGDLLNVPLTLMTDDPDSPRLTIRLVGIIDKKQQ
ncbi:MAG: DUF1573 domain-containing protein [Muribaculaceae bacterium]|nr:DUF1573 domain-containing protein [Muribaculaceae bacterium]